MNTLTRPAQGRILAGVCAALADRYGMKRSTVRLLTVASVVLPGPQVLIYLALWALIPGEHTHTAPA